MIRRFGTFENASFFVATMREKGHYAEILDEGAGFLYGSILTSGFRVIVSEQALQEDEEPPEDFSKTGSTFDKVIRNAVLVALSAIGVVGFISFLKAYQHSHATIPIALIEAVGGILIASCICAYIAGSTRE